MPVVAKTPLQLFQDQILPRLLSVEDSCQENKRIKADTDALERVIIKRIEDLEEQNKVLAKTIVKLERKANSLDRQLTKVIKSKS